MRDILALVRAIAPLLWLPQGLLRRLRALRRWRPHSGSDDDGPMVLSRGPAEPVERLPSVLLQSVPSRTPDDVVEIVYLQNDTDRTALAKVRSKFSVTVDDETGAALRHGAPGTDVVLAPGERVRIGDVLGWEWDSVRTMEIDYRHAADDAPRRVSYNLGGRGRLREVAGLGEVLDVEPFVLG